MRQAKASKLLACLALAFHAGTSTAAPAAPGKAPGWRLAPQGFGPLKIGMSFDSARGIAGPRLQPTPRGLRASPSCDYLPLPGHPGVSLMFTQGRLRRVDLMRPGLQTTRGVGPGDPVEKAMRAYPGLVAAKRAYVDDERTLTARSGPNAIRFETEQGRIANVYAGRWTEVQYIEGCL